MGHAKRVAKNTGILYLRMMLTVFISLYATRIILEELGADNFGVYAVLASSVAIFGFLNGAVTSATQRFIAFGNLEKDIEKKKNTFSISMVLHIVMALLFVILVEIISVFLFSSVLNLPESSILIAKKIIHFMILGQFFVIITSPYLSVIMAHENMLVVAIIGIIESVLKLGIAYLIVYTVEDKLFLYGVSMSALTLILLLINALYCHVKYSEVTLRVIKYFNWKEMRKMTNFAGWSFLGISSTMITSHGQGIVLNVFFGTVVNAAYGIASQVNGQLSVLATVLLKALNPAITKTEGSGDRKAMLKLSIMGSRISFYLLMLVVIIALVEMPFIFNLWLKEVPEYVVIFCRLLLLRSLIEQMFIPLISTINAVGDIKSLNIQFTILCLIPLPLSYLLFSLGYPAYAMYIIYVVYSVFFGVIIIHQAKTKCKLDIKEFYSKVLLPCFLISIFCLLLASIPKIYFDESYNRLFMTIILSTVSSLSLIWFFGLQKNEKENISLTIKKLIKK